MTIPPFPSQDLAKLVLGYLAEEQLMTVYDEFLQASPYLDALRNEYDRIFMTSLKSILAEYRAVKILVDTCKPFLLRKKLFQCSNLLEVIKFLISNVDCNKLQLLDAAEKESSEKYITAGASKSNICEVCSSQCASGSCVVCGEGQSAGDVEASAAQHSLEATPLADLPGNYVTKRKKLIKVLEKESFTSSTASSDQNTVLNAKDLLSSSISEEPPGLTSHINSNSKYITKSFDNSTLKVNTSVKATNSSESIKNQEEFNDVSKLIIHKNNSVSSNENVSKERISNANSFQDFAIGVSGGEQHTATVPDSSTSENLSTQVPLSNNSYYDNVKGRSNHTLLLQVVNDKLEIKTCKEKPSNKLTKIKPKTEEQKIKIISDIKVGNKFSDKIKDNTRKKPNSLKNATSTPLMQMQTIVINGTPAYKHNAINSSYTKDEIMAMPTLIVVPASGPSKKPTSSHCNSISTEDSSAGSVPTSASPQLLGPLVIDVPSSPAPLEKALNSATSDLPKQTLNPPTGLIKTIDLKNASVPKDTGATTVENSSTPQVFPPLRKSSSTPRRNSHIRVLDFTTPRRILHETINEQAAVQGFVTTSEIIISGSPNMTHTPTTVSAQLSHNTLVTGSGSVPRVDKCFEMDSASSKENSNADKINPKKNTNWDADLRALAVPNDNAPVKGKSKRNTKKKKSVKTLDNEKNAVDDKCTSKTNKKAKIKKRRVVIEDEEPLPDVAATKHDVPLKPTINIITERVHIDREEPCAQNKSHDKEDVQDTPDGDRLSLQNVIGAKLNISEFLETPYKQALYDIQMETPRFLGPDLPDDPMSDIKIMNIPTPRFLNTPMLGAVTPSSYSSRPTDYSSGGSYYKPDDQEILIPDIICPVTSSKDVINVGNTKDFEKENDGKRNRPVRQCTKNVSYYKNTSIVKTNIDEIADATSSCSESYSVNSNIEVKKETGIVTKSPIGVKSKNQVKSETKKRVSTVKKKKSPAIKEKSKSFLKIKPRQSPSKLTPSSRSRKKINEVSYHNSPNLHKRNRTNSREKNVIVTPVVASGPTKSRRKSSSPRKLHRTKNPIPEDISTSTNSPETDTKSTCQVTPNPPDSDTEQIALRWSDDGSQDTKTKDFPNNSSVNDGEDITQIQKFIESSGPVKVPSNECGGSLQADLIKRGFDVETAKIIERDLLDTPPNPDLPSKISSVSVEIVSTKEVSFEKSLETDSSATNDMNVEDEAEGDEIELSVHECNEESDNYFVFEHDDTKESCQGPLITLKDKFSMEVCIDEELTVRLRANPFSLLLDQDPMTVDEIDYSYKETELAVSSIYNMERLYTPLKDSIKAQCLQFFDSTLTSLDTPLKATTEYETTVTEIVLEEERPEPKDKTETKKRKRLQNDDNVADSKKSKQDPQYLLNSTNIQNIDIESVLKKLHGP